MENTQPENFFETLAEERAQDEHNFEIQLAKAAGGGVRSASRKKEHDTTGEPEGQLTIDVYQTPEYIVIESAVAGVRPEDLDINATTDSVTIRGERSREQEVKDDDYFYQECYWGRFSRSVILPQEVDPESAEVSFKNGILTIRLPKTNKQKTKRLKVKFD